MTDNEIITALECCGIIGCECVQECPRYNNGMYESACQRDLIISANALINRQKAEIERLKSMNQSKLDMIHDLRAENERLNKAIDNYEACLKSVEIIKENAVKEFAERLKESSFECDMWLLQNRYLF